MRRRVVVTGIGVVSPLGVDYPSSLRALRAGEHGIAVIEAWEAVSHLFTRLGAPAKEPDFSTLPRHTTRTMGRVAMLAAIATEEALRDAGIDAEAVRHPDVMLAYGSTHGSSSANEHYVRKLFTQTGFRGLSSSNYIKFMSNTTAVNLGVHFGLTGRIMSTCAACVSSSQAVGYAYESVRYGLAEVAIAGGSEELHFTHAGVFDTMFATSRAFNDRPDLSPRPFDVRRDGLVVGEGAGSFVLESYERAVARGATIHAEVLGYGTNCDGSHATNPSPEGMQNAMQRALDDAQIGAEAIDYVNAHATATPIGDVAESRATHALFGDRVPVSSLKGHMGHTLGGCGTIEAALVLGMMREGFVAPTRNLEQVDPECAPLDYVMGGPRTLQPHTVLSNKFAFGGINTSLVFRRV